MKIIIEGAGQVGTHLAKMLSAEGSDVSVIESDAALLKSLAEKADVTTIPGESSSPRILRSAGCSKADLFIAVNKSMSVNIVSAILAKKLGAQRSVARIETEEYLSPENELLFRDMGIDMLFYPEKTASDETAQLLRQNYASDSLDFAQGKIQLSAFKVDDDSLLLDMTVADFVKAVSSQEGGNRDFRIVALSRNSQTIIPRFDTKFKYGDNLYIMACKDAIPALAGFLGQDSLDVKRIMILGGSDIGRMVAERFAETDPDEIKLVEIDRARCRKLSEELPDIVNVVCGDARNTDFLMEEDILSYQVVIAATGNDELNILASVGAKKLGVTRVIAQIENLEYIHLAEEMGIDTVLNKKLITASRIFKFTLSDKVHSVRYMSGTDAEVLEYTVAKGSKITKAPLKDIDFPEDAIIGGVVRGEESFIAVGDTRIEAFDRVAVFALPSAVKKVNKLFN